VSADEPAHQALLIDVQRRIEALYGLPSHEPVTAFLLTEQQAAALPGGGSRTLVSEDADGVSLGVVLDAGVLERLGHDDPRERLHGGNLDPFCTATEEVSHFVYLLFCATSGRSITQLELELQGEVDKYLNAFFVLALQNEGVASARLREQLFRRYRLANGVSPERAERYHAASRLADRYCGFLERRFLKSRRLGELAREARRFYRLGQSDKLERIACVG